MTPSSSLLFHVLRRVAVCRTPRVGTLGAYSYEWTVVDMRPTSDVASAPGRSWHFPWPMGVVTVGGVSPPGTALSRTRAGAVLRFRISHPAEKLYEPVPGCAYGPCPRFDSEEELIGILKEVAE